MSRIKVVFSIGSMHGGGSERQLVSLLRCLDREKFDPQLYLVYRAGPLLEEIPADVPITSFEERCGVPRGPGFLMHRQRIADMSRFLQECQADVTYDRTFLMTLISAAAAQQIGVPNVSTIVTDPPIGFPAVAGRFQWIKKRILKRLYEKSACVLANSEGAARSAERFYHLPPDTVRVLWNGVDLAAVRARAQTEIHDEWWNEGPADGRVFRIVTAGRLDRHKGFQLLIDAISEVRRKCADTDIRLAILGQGPLHDALSQQIRTAGLQNVVRLQGFRTEAPAWYASADLFVLPSLLEGMPNVILEAMACGTPVLSADCDSGPREILNRGQFGLLCDVGSSEALTAGILRFVTDDSLGSRYASAALSHVDQSFTIESATRKLEQIFEDVTQPR